MSDRIINYYEFPERSPDWVKLKQMFKCNVSKHNYPYFEANSELERDFFRYCEASNLTVHKGTLIEYDREATETGKFLFLCLKDDGGDCISESGLGFIDSSAACPGGDAFGICGRGARQVNKVSIRSQGGQKIQTLGLLTARHPNVPKIYVSSAEVAEVLTKAKASGCQIVPTEQPKC